VDLFVQEVRDLDRHLCASSIVGWFTVSFPTYNSKGLKVSITKCLDYLRLRPSGTGQSLYEKTLFSIRKSWNNCFH
jgi:hypothetical protein